jgi:hypothetical protein
MQLATQLYDDGLTQVSLGELVVKDRQTALGCLKGRSQLTLMAEHLCEAIAIYAARRCDAVLRGI